MRIVALVLVVASQAGCFSPSYGECAFACAQSGACPHGYSCDPVRKLCCRGGVTDRQADRQPADGDGRVVDRGPDQPLPTRELAWSCDTDVEWGAGQLTGTKVSVGALRLELAKGSATKGPGTVADAASGRPWAWLNGTTPVYDPSVLAKGTHIFVDLSSPASGDNVSRLLMLTSFGFVLPDGALVDGVVLAISRQQSGDADEIKDDAVRLVVNGATAGDDKKGAGFWPNPYQTASYGSSTDRWGLLLDRSTVNAASFGASLRARNYYAGDVSAWVASAQLTMHFTQGRGEWLSPTIALAPGAVRWDTLESQASTPAGCGPAAQALSFDIVSAGGGDLLAGLSGSPIDLSTIKETTLRIRVRLRTASSTCNPSVDYLRLYCVR